MEVLRTEVESDENEEERVEWGTRKYGVRMSHPGYVGRGDDTCGGSNGLTDHSIHCGVEVTVLSTNKQHTLSLRHGVLKS